MKGLKMLKPVLHRLLIKPDPLENVTDSGIVYVLDKREQDAGVTGTVVAIGNTAFLAYSTTPQDEGITVGTKIYYAKYSGAKIKDSEYLWLNDADILGVITEDDTNE